MKHKTGHIHKYEAVLWTLEKLRKTCFCHKMINFFLGELTFSGNMYFSYTKRLASAKVKKNLSLQRNDKKSHIVTDLSNIWLLEKVFSRIII